MRALVISLIFLMLAGTVIAAGSLYLDSLTGEMLSLIEALPDSCEAPGGAGSENFNRLCALWSLNHEIAALAVSYDYLGSINLSLVTAKRLYEEGDRSDYLAARDLLREHVLRLHELEHFSVDNLL